MNTEIRKPFSLEEQRAKDLLAAIKTVTPVIDLIREWGKQEKEYNEVMEKEKALSKEIESIRYVREISYTEGELRDSLSTILERKEASYKEVSEKVKKLKAICDSYENEVINYRKYVKLFIDVDEDAMLDVLELELLKTKDEGLAIVFFVVNQSSFEVGRLKGSMPGYFEGVGGCMYRLLSQPDWNNMLRELKAGKI